MVSICKYCHCECEKERVSSAKEPACRKCQRLNQNKKAIEKYHQQKSH